MSYLYLRVTTNEDGDVEESLAAKIEAICPCIDLSRGFDHAVDWDEDENEIYYHTFAYGNEDFCDDEMNSLKGRDWDIENELNDCEVWAYYIDFTRMEETEKRIFANIADGSQFGYSNKLMYAIQDLFACEKNLDNLKTDIESNNFWDLGRRQVRVINGKTFYSDSAQIFTNN